MEAELWRAVALVGVGVGAGLCATIAGLASLVSYPALLAFGLPPVAANVTNTVALVATGFGAVTGSRRELAGQRRRVLRFAVASGIGGGVGALLLLATPAAAFQVVVPFLVAGACVVVLAQPWAVREVRRRAASGGPVPMISPAPAIPPGSAGAAIPTGEPVRAARQPEDRTWVLVGVGAVAVYGGYFGAAAGVLTLAVLSGVLPESLPRVNAVKNALGMASNGVAAVGFALFGPVDWTAALPLMLGFFLGGRIGPAVVRRLPAGLLRIVIAVAGLGLATRLYLQSR